MMEISIASRCRLETQGSFFSNISRTIGQEHAQKLPHNVAAHGSRWCFHRLASSYRSLPLSEYRRRPFVCRTYSLTSRLEESASLQSGNSSSEDDNPEEETLAQPCTTDQIMALLADTERSKLTKKLSEANQQNRFLKRQLYIKEEALVKFKSELADIELEVQALARLAEEIAQSGIPQGARKINGKYIHSHLVARLEAVHEQLKEQVKDVDAAQSKQVSVFWVGMAESVQVMGSFDGWSQGEHLSPEFTSSYTRFSTTLMLRPGRYEIKFLVDGEWHLSSEFPIIGDGLTKNNLLVVK
ncbi:PREDICTED: protein PTST, chloroplastic isoform X1 [Lupinus angustifolius]|uniref:protein PTST, chloroplastic isoform X1 n=1 Tax=Lupinus angustifolius TaxID=3871 RepID=UPI00092F73C0|nr:PREDICTED: protein PTST, chloroplastic isoform X1 [Lupinus angustifolius]